MTAPSEMQVATILLAIIMPLFGCALNATLNIRIKFAADAAQAIRERNRILLRVVTWIANLYSAGSIGWLLMFSPLTKVSLVGILSCCFTLFNSYMWFFVGSLRDAQIDLCALTKEHCALTKELLSLMARMQDGISSDVKERLSAAIEMNRLIDDTRQPKPK